MSATPKSTWGWFRRCCTELRPPDSEAVHSQFDRSSTLWPRTPHVAEHLEGGPRGHPRLHSVPEGGLAPDLVQSTKRAAQPRETGRTDVVGIFPTVQHLRLVAPSWPSSTTNGPRPPHSDSTFTPLQAVDAESAVEEVTEPELQAITA